MYEPNFCPECGVRFARSRRSIWASRQFCPDCSTGFGKKRLVVTMLIGASLLVAGFSIGRYLRPPSPPLIIQRSALSPLADLPVVTQAAKTDGVSHAASRETIAAEGSELAEVVYTCGARTKKGTPCLRRVHEPVRCWQHKGMPAIPPQDNLRVQ